MNITVLIQDSAVMHTIQNYLDMLETSTNDPPRSPPDGGYSYERVYDHLPPGDELLPDP